MPTPRLAWVDIAKGISIVLVVLHHAVIRNPDNPMYSAIVVQLNDTLVLFRMPLFFFTAGFFVGKLLERPFAEGVAKRLAQLLYVYILWSVVRWLVTGVVPVSFLGSEESLRWIAVIAWDPPPTLWFIYALAAFTAMAWLTRMLPKTVVLLLALAACVAVASGGDVYEYHLPFHEQLARFFLWFYLGHVLSDRILGMAHSVRPWHLALVPIWFAAASVLTGASNRDAVALMLLMSATGIAMGVVVAVNLAGTPLRAALSYVGRSTLPIYVAHFIPIMVVRRLAPELPLLLGVAIAVAAPLVFYEMATRLRLQWLFERPAIQWAPPFIAVPRPDRSR